MREVTIRIIVSVGGNKREVKVHTIAYDGRIRITDPVSKQEFASFTTTNMSVVDPRNRAIIKELAEIYYMFRQDKIRTARQAHMEV